MDANALLRGPAVYFDGTSSARNAVTVETAAAGLRILAGGGDGRNGLPDRVLDEWAYSELRRMSAPEGVLRLGRRGETLLARLEIRAPALAAAIEDRAEALDRGGAAERRLRRKVVALSFAAAASLVVTAVIGLPALASRIIPFVPLAVDRKLGDADRQERPRFARYAASRRGFRLRHGAERNWPAAPRSISSSASSKRSPRCRSRCMSRWCAAPSPTPWRCPAATFTSMTG